MLFSYRFRAQAITGEYVIFTLGDIPVRITPDAFILAAKPNSLILKLNTIVCGADMLDLFEGDVVRIKDNLYTVRYMRGFSLIRNDRFVLYYNQLNDFTIVKRNSFKKYNVVFKINKDYFTFSDIIGVKDGYLLTANIKTPIDILSVQQDTRTSINKKRLYFGNDYNENVLFMKYGRIVVEVKNGVYDVFKKFTIWER
ncbi:MAG: hypothetical protein LBS29_04665 [Endomicrobium sp.]|jgi:hypothetical protein|nr:hypothetical protein [Endomicrobium sp.]